MTADQFVAPAVRAETVVVAVRIELVVSRAVWQGVVIGVVVAGRRICDSENRVTY
ncbi:MAG: hypothetical protein MK160_06705 [Rhodobacteraceae bacterium]|nr:hypothetical protein [Paracoccaceae bacterium]